MSEIEEWQQERRLRRRIAELEDHVCDLQYEKGMLECSLVYWKSKAKKKERWWHALIL